MEAVSAEQEVRENSAERNVEHVARVMYRKTKEAEPEHALKECASASARKRTKERKDGIIASRDQRATASGVCTDKRPIAMLDNASISRSRTRATPRANECYRSKTLLLQQTYKLALLSNISISDSSVSETCR